MPRCDWFKCNQPFKPGSHNARFCSNVCAAAEGNWRAMRGKPLVPLLILWRKSRNWNKGQKRAWEDKHNRPIPTITNIARRVDEMILEQKEGRPK